MATTYGELYDQFLDKLYGEAFSNVPSWMVAGSSPAEAMKENDPDAYRCGFSDWTSGLRYQRLDCDDCGRRIEDFDVCDDDEVLCPVCNGPHYKCDDCNEVFELPYFNYEGRIVCEKCADAAHAEDEEEEDEV